MSRLSENPDFAVAIDAAAAELGMPAAVIEKDYWVTQALRALAAGHPGDWVFKGGTSLSKAYGLLQRFSEDIDILVLPGDRGETARDTLMKAMARSAAVALTRDLPASTTSQRGVHRTYDIPYPTASAPVAALRPAVRLEMGIRGGSQPHAHREIAPLIADATAITASDYPDLEAFSVPVLHPGRTLIEKLLLVHGAAHDLTTDPSAMPPAGFGRHLYDIHQLLADDTVHALLADRAEFTRVAEEAFAIGAGHFGTSAARPHDGFASSPAFTAPADSPTTVAFTASLVQARDLAFPDAGWPTLDEVRRRVASHALLL